MKRKLIMEEKLFSAPRWWDDPGFLPAQCNSCKNLILPIGACKGFGVNIPREILMDEVIHDKPYPGDNGYQYMKRCSSSGQHSEEE